MPHIVHVAILNFAEIHPSGALESGFVTIPCKWVLIQILILMIIIANQNFNLGGVCVRATNLIEIPTQYCPI